MISKILGFKHSMEYKSKINFKNELNAELPQTDFKTLYLSFTRISASNDIFFKLI